MENASKALIMAGGMLLAILTVSLLAYAWNLFSEYQASHYNLATIEDTAKFNQEFTAYDRDGVKGYEIISLVNKITDYNTRKSVESATSSEKYTSIDITVNFLNGNNKNLTKDGNNNKLITQTSNNKGTLATIIAEATTIEDRWGGSDSASKIANGIDSIFVGDTATTDKKNAGIKKFNSLNTNSSGITYQIKSSDSDINNVYKQLEANEKGKAYKYYEYVQFKRSLFNSRPAEVKYDNVTGRIKQMVFEFVKIY